ncbi:hypothetical protein [Microbacterium sp. NPDC057944]|uniref:hypothetical protein n=1 Tax=Microbacterium sp. NPDC057944 TaxID=3346286 RepID=UPI0036DAAC2A
MNPRRMPFTAMLRQVALTLAIGAVVLVLDTWIFGSIPWQDVPARNLSALRGCIGVVGIGAVLTLAFALAVRGWSPATPRAALSAWLVSGALVSLTATAVWLAVAPGYLGSGGWTVSSLMLTVLPPVVATSAFVALIACGLVARRRGIYTGRAS